MKFFRTIKGRSYSGYAWDHIHGFIMSGGQGMDDDDKPLAHVETTSDGVTFNHFASLPVGLSHHCLVSLNNAGDLFLSGGHDGEDHLGNTYMFLNNKGSWDPVEAMPTARDEVACGPVRGNPGGPVEEVVVAGGCTGDPSSVVEIFNIKLESWRAGKKLPFGIVEQAAAVPHHNTFLLIGGRVEGTFSDDYMDEVFEYKAAHDVWERLPGGLSSPRYGVTAIVISSEMIPSCNTTVSPNPTV